MKIERIEAEAWLAKAKPEGLPEKLRESGADAKGFSEGYDKAMEELGKLEDNEK